MNKENGKGGITAQSGKKKRVPVLHIPGSATR
jgi:hypothetical protein